MRKKAANDTLPLEAAPPPSQRAPRDLPAQAPREPCEGPCDYDRVVQWSHVDLEALTICRRHQAAAAEKAALPKWGHETGGRR